MKNSLPTSDTIKKSPEQQREELLRLNNDILYGVYEIITNLDVEIQLKLSNNTLTCYPNQLNNLKGLGENKDISILDINALRKGKIEFLVGDKSELHNPVLLSNGIIEEIKAKKQDGTYRSHTYTTLRDGGAADKLQRTGVAGRNSSDNLGEEVEREYTEESPFLSQINGVWTIATPKRENDKEAKKDLITSIKYFLENKYNLDRNNSEQTKFIKMFERSFKGIKYEELGNILKEIIKNDRIIFFENKELDNIPGLEGNIKKLSIIDEKGGNISSGKYFIYHDKINNTFEYRSLREIQLPKGINPRQRLFLESQNQYAKTHRLESLTRENLVPTMKYFADKVKEIIK